VALHDIGIREFGGTMGLRDKGLLESAAFQPQQSFGGEELYPTLFDKASAYAYFISESQPFLDGNKRTAISAAAVFLDLNGYEVRVAQGAIYDVMMEVANKRMDRNQLADWFKKNSRKKKKFRSGIAPDLS
jgi:death-on-curing protein